MNKIFFRRLIVSIGLFFLPLNYSQASRDNILRVPEDYPGIHEAMDAAVDGDTVLVNDGTYVEQINFKGKAITVISRNGPSMTTISGWRIDPYGSIVQFENGEGPDSKLSGFTITLGNEKGGGIYCSNASPTITNNIISNNFASYGGGAGIFITGPNAKPLIQDNIITENQGYFDTKGAGILVTSGAPRIINNIITLNRTSNGGSSIYISAANAILVNNTITQNEGPLSLSGNVSIVNTILWDNGGVEEINGDLRYIDVQYSIVQGGWEGEGNIDRDPHFINILSGDYNLGNFSPAIDAAHGVWAEAKDQAGQDRYDDRGVGNKGFGIPGYYPDYVDIGALERQTDSKHTPKHWSAQYH